jgi:hypothetical protein
MVPQAAENHGYPIETVVSSMQRSCALNLVIVDACRSPARGMRSAAAEEESSRAWGSAKLEGGRNTLICNACKSLHTASDGVAGKNGLYTEALLKVRRTPSKALVCRSHQHKSVNPSCFLCPATSNQHCWLAPGAKVTELSCNLHLRCIGEG